MKARLRGAVSMAVFTVVVPFALAACDTRSLPEPVQLTPSAIRLAPADPAFDALPGATAYYGELNGGAFQIEIPDDWNGSLVIYMCGSQQYSERPTVLPPSIRHHLIEHGYAWAASSYDRTDIIFGIAADQSAALWDYFAERFRRPRHTYVVGDSMGGGGALISAERYEDRYDGALSMCGVAGAERYYSQFADLVTAGARAARIPDDELTARTLETIIYDRIQTAIINEPSVRTAFLRAWIELSGGDRPYGAQGFFERENALWSLALQHITEAHAVADSDVLMRDRPSMLEVYAESFADPRESITGDLEIPVLALHTTGDGLVPLSHVWHIRDAAAKAGKAELLAIALVPDPRHCWFTEGEEWQAFEALVTWVTEGEAPGCLPPDPRREFIKEAMLLSGC